MVQIHQSFVNVTNTTTTTTSTIITTTPTAMLPGSCHIASIYSAALASIARRMCCKAIWLDVTLLLRCSRRIHEFVPACCDYACIGASEFTVVLTYSSAAWKLLHCPNLQCGPGFHCKVHMLQENTVGSCTFRLHSFRRIQEFVPMVVILHVLAELP